MMSRRFRLTIAVLAVAVSSAYGQDLAQTLNAQFRVMQKDANGVITGGTTLMLQKNGFLMYSTSMPSPPQSTYKDGKISYSSLGGFGRDLANKMTLAGESTIPQWTFTAGEDLSLGKIDVRNDGVVLTLYSGVYDGVAYRGELKFPYRKNSPPPADQMLSTIAEVFAVQSPGEPAPQVLLGNWEGTIQFNQAGGPPLRLALTISNGTSGAKAMVVSLDQGNARIPASKVIINGAKVTLEAKSVGGVYQGELNQEGSAMDGTWSQRGMTTALLFKKASETHAAPQVASASASAATAPQPPPLPPIDAPPPPPPDPASIKVGQTTDEVVAAMGQPKSIVDLGTKKIYVYPEIKLTFVNGKMTTAE